MANAVRTHWKPMLAFAVIEIVGPWYTLTDAERHLSSSTAGLLIAGVPIVGVLLSLPHSRLRSSGGPPSSAPPSPSAPAASRAWPSVSAASASSPSRT
ncbi:hypothetical protein R2F25_25890 [Streptomyces sp. UP1A-1]|nr:hypothetical protein [Streptomyces sp. UP1A-1]